MTGAGPAAAPAGRAAPRVSIVIPTFNRVELTLTCLDGLRRTAPDAEIVVVDNGSTDGTREALAEAQDAGRLRCVLNDRNLGFGTACNRAAALARGELVLLLNNDVVPLPGWLDAMLGELDDPAVGIVGSRLLYPDGRIQHAGANFTPLAETEHVHRHAAADDPAVVVSRDLPAVTGASMLVRRTLWERLGGLDEGYFMYVEDVDLCVRAWHAGYRVRYCADSVLVHFESQSSPDAAWCHEQLRTSWQRFHDRWLGRFPAALLEVAANAAFLGPRRRWNVVADAEELAADPALLDAWAAAFDARDAVTLTIVDAAASHGGVSPGLVAAVERAGLAGEDAADLVAVPCDGPAAARLLACGLDAVLSRSGLGEEFASLPRYDAGSLAGLRALLGGLPAAA